MIQIASKFTQYVNVPESQDPFNMLLKSAFLALLVHYSRVNGNGDSDLMINLMHRSLLFKDILSKQNEGINFKDKYIPSIVGFVNEDRRESAEYIVKTLSSNPIFNLVSSFTFICRASCIS